MREILPPAPNLCPRGLRPFRPGTDRFLEGPASPINTVTLASDCSAVASSAGYWQDLRRPDSLGRMVHVGNTRDDSPLAVALSAGGNRVMAGYEDGILRLWDIDGSAPPAARDTKDESGR